MNIAKALQINERFAQLLREERNAPGRTLDQVAQKLSLSHLDLLNWEHGRKSPPAKIFYAVMEYYGPGALQRAAMLDFEIQMEKLSFVRGLSHTEFRHSQSAA